MKIYSYNNASAGAKKLASALGVFLIKHENSKFKGDSGSIVINWGSSNLPKEVKKCKVINRNIPGDKHEMLSALSTRFDVPAFTKDKEQADAWAEDALNITLKKGVYYTEIEFESIFRVHQFPGKSVRIQYKQGEPKEIPDAVRTLIKQTCEDIRKYLNLDFCSITLGKAPDKYYVLSVNTAPELTDDLAAVYASNIKEMLYDF